MYTIYFKGDMKSIEVNDEQGEVVMQTLKEGSRGFVELGGKMFDVAAVKGIVNSDENFGKNAFKATKEDLQKLSEALTPFKQKEVNGKLLSPFDQYLISIGVLGQYDNGVLFCYKPVEFDRLSKTNSQMELIDYFKWKNAQTPEDLDVHWERIKRDFPLKPANTQRTNQTKSIGDILKGRTV